MGKIEGLRRRERKEETRRKRVERGEERRGLKLSPGLARMEDNRGFAVKAVALRCTSPGSGLVSALLSNCETRSLV